MPRIPDFAAPSVGLQSQQSGGALQAPRVVPYQDQRIRQTQELAQTVQGIGTEVMRYGQQLSAEYDDAKVKQGDNRLADVIRKELEDPTNGYLNQVGEKAIGKTREDAFKRIEQQAQSLMQGMDNDTQRQAFSMQVERQMRQALGRADEHEARQTKAFAIGQTKGRVDSLSMEALRSVGTPQFGAVKGAMVKETQSLLTMAGIPLDSEQAKNAVLSVTTDLHDQAIRGMVEQDPQGARAYLAEHRAEIAPDKANGLDGLVRTAGIHQQGDALAREVQGKGDLMQQWALIDARQDLSVEARDDAKQRAQRNEAVAYQSEQRGAAQALADLQTWAQNNLPEAGEYGPMAPPPAALIEQARKYGVADDYDLWAKNGGQYVTTARGTNLLLALPDSALQGYQSAGQVVAAFRTSMSDQDLARMVNRWEKTQVRPSEKAMLASEIESVVNNEARAAGVLPKTYKEKDLGPAETAAYQKWDIALRARVRTATAGREATVKDFQEQAAFLRAEKFKAGSADVMVTTATDEQIAAGVWTVETEPGTFDQIQANVVNQYREVAIKKIVDSGIPIFAISEIDIATQAYQEAKRDNAANENAQAETVKRQENAHRALYSLFQTSLVMKGDRELAKRDALGMVTAETARALGITLDDAQSMADNFFGASQDNAMQKAWEAKRGPVQNDGTFPFWRRQSEAFQRWLFTGQEKARQENARRFPNDPQFRYENVWGQPAPTFINSPTPEQMIEFQRGETKQ